MEPEISETKQEGSRDVDAELRILSSLAKPEALKVFAACEVGIESSTEAIKKICLTPKCYYTNLKRLIEAGLVEKRGNIYVRTMLGKFCAKLGKTFLIGVSHRDQLQLADKLMDSDTFSIEEKERVLHAISQKEIFGVARLMDVIHEVKMIDEYDVFINEIIEMLNNAEETAHIAANSTDLKVIDAMVKAANRGVKFFILSSSNKPFTERLHTLKLVLSPEVVKMFRDYFFAEGLSIRLANLSYNFCLTDQEYGILELQHPGGESSFYAAFKFRNKILCQKLTKAFNSLYENGKEDPLLNYIRKIFSSYKNS